MITWCCLFFAAVVQYTSAQSIPYGMPNAITMGRGIPNGMSLPANQIVRNIPMAANNMARGNNFNRQNLANSYFAYGNIANPNTASANIVNPNNQVFANDITAAALSNFANPNISPNVGKVTANAPIGATYNFGNSAIPVTVNGISHSNQPVGINILADNLEVQGMVSVVGRMPIFGAVTLNGNVPSDGKASVSYSCGSPAAV